MMPAAPDTPARREPEGFQGFPDDREAGRLRHEYRRKVAPPFADRRRLSATSSMILLRVPGTGLEYRERVRRVIDALERPLTDGGKLVPYGVLSTESVTAATPLIAMAAREDLAYNLPRHMTPDRFPHSALVRDVILRALRDPLAAFDADVLRRAAYAGRVARGGLPCWLHKVSGTAAAGDGAVGGVIGFVLSAVWQPLTDSLPRWWWTRRMTHQLIRPAWLSLRRGARWLGAELDEARGSADLFEILATVLDAQRAGLALDTGHPSHRAALQALELLLVQALLADLAVPPAGRLLPRRRRRTAAPVLLVRIPEDTRRAEAVERFLSACHAAGRTAASHLPVLIAVGRPSDTLLAALGNPVAGTLGQAADALRAGDGRPVLVPLDEEPFGRPGQDIARVDPRRFKLPWRAVHLTAWGIVAALVLTPLAFPLGSGRESCVGGDDTVAAARTEPVRVRPAEWYDAAVGEITRQNARAEQYAAQGRTVRTVVWFSSEKPVDETDTLYDGTIPELRGVALWQRKLNDDAGSDEALVPLRVEIRTTGKAFHDAERSARKLVAEVRSGKRTGERQIVGVLGFEQSRKETAAALGVLGKARIPAVGTTATADEMIHNGDYRTYWPFTPLNKTEAGIEADFARTFPIVPRPGPAGGCAPADHAIVIQTPADLYSRGLAGRFRDSFEGEIDVLDYAQDGDFSGAGADDLRFDSAENLADEVCRRLRESPGSLVYWSARAREFTAFINAMDHKGTCGDRDVTVLGGNDLTNVAQTGAFNDKHWLRLYFSGHRLPDTDPRAGTKTRDFADAYDRFVRTTTRGTDPWRQDGHAAVAYDALHVLSLATDLAYRDEHAAPGAVLTALGSDSIRFDGATGYVSYHQGVNQPPADKTLVLLRQTAEGPVAVVACGAYRQGRTYAAHGEPCTA